MIFGCFLTSKNRPPFSKEPELLEIGGAGILWVQAK